MKKLTSILFTSLLMIFCFIIFMSSTFAASNNPALMVRNAGGIQVWTNKKGSTPKVTLNQSKVTFTYYNNEVDKVLGKQKSKTVYPVYDVEITPKLTVDGGKTTYKSSSKKLNSSSLTISLKKGIYYEIDIYYNNEETLEKAGLSNKIGVKGDGSYVTQHWSFKEARNCGNYKVNRIYNKRKF